MQKILAVPENGMAFFVSADGSQSDRSEWNEDRENPYISYGCSSTDMIDSIIRTAAFYKFRERSESGHFV